MSSNIRVATVWGLSKGSDLGVRGFSMSKYLLLEILFRVTWGLDEHNG